MFGPRKPLVIKKSTVTVKRTPNPQPAHNPPPQYRKTAPRPKPARVESARTERSDRSSPISSTKRKLQRPASATPDFGRDDEESDSSDDFMLEERSKRQRVDLAQHSLPKRDVRSKAAFEESDDMLSIVHATEIPGLDKTTKYEPVFKGLSEGFEVQFQYPSAAKKEK
jgi:hypothetical protein